MKFERDPLHADGFREINLFQLDAYFLDPFKNQTRRLYLIEKFKAFISAFSALGINAEIWLDGSFTTNDEDPQDIDMVFLLNQTEVDSLDTAKQKIFSELIIDREKAKIAYNCDVYFIREDDSEGKEYYMRLFGMERNGQNKKGIFKIILKR